jgi:hypothetical protein
MLNFIYAESHKYYLYAECRYAECRGSLFNQDFKFVGNPPPFGQSTFLPSTL